MRKIALVHTAFELGEGVRLNADDLLELSLDCFVCRRCHRTVGLRAGLEEGVCTPTNHPFPGAILSKNVQVLGSEAIIEHKVEFWFAPFEDIKRGGQAVGTRHWARVRFSLDCPRCQRRTSSSVQTNLVRPFSDSCECGFELFTDVTEENPSVAEGPLT